MNIIAASPTNSPSSLADCLQAVQTALLNLKDDSLDSATQTLGALRKVAFVLAEIFARCPDAEAHRIASADWPQEFLLLKIALQTGLSDREKKFINTVKEHYEQGAKAPEFTRHLILARLLIVPADIAHPKSWQEISIAYLGNFIAYQLETCPIVLPSDGEKACQHQERILSQLLDYISSPTTSVAERNKFISLYLNTKNTPYYEMADINIRPIALLTNKILRVISGEAFKACPIDYAFPPKAAGEKVRIGLLAKTLLAGVETIAMLCNISGLDRRKYHITLLHYNADAGYYSAIDYYRELVNSVDEIIRIDPAPVDKCVTAIRELNLDLLWHQTSVGIMDTGSAAFLLVYKLARIQCAMAATCGRTTGNPYFQYFLNVKPPVIPKTWEGELTETELNVSSSCIYIPNDWQHKPNRIVTRESLGVPANAVIYFAGAAAAKYTHECVAMWLDIIRRVPNSYIILAPLNPGWTPRKETILAFHSILQMALIDAGIGADRVRIVGHVNGEAIALMHKWGDVHLSSFPYGGVSTLIDSLRGGLCPVCTMGRYSRNCGDASILVEYGLTDFVARTPQDYLDLAVRFGEDPDFRAATKLRVREAYAKRHPLIKKEIAASYANLIDQIVQREFS